MDKFAKLMDWGTVSLKQACCLQPVTSGTRKILCVKIVTVFKLKGNPFFNLQLQVVLGVAVVE